MAIMDGHGIQRARSGDDKYRNRMDVAYLLRQEQQNKKLRQDQINLMNYNLRKKLTSRSNMSREVE